MTSELLMLIGGAASIAFIHTLLGPDHYLPFVAVAKARGWSLSRTLGITALCGIGHSAGSIILGLVGIYAGRALADLEMVEALRGDTAAWVLLAFGLVYFAWGMKRSKRHKSHSHLHTHGDGTLHRHTHNHATTHAHIHEAKAGKGRMRIFTPWALFIIFVLGPCEPLIPLMMIPAASGEWIGMVLTVGVFMLVTIVTMTAVVVAATLGLRSFNFTGFEKYSHAFAGGTLSLCGMGMITLGL
ncbi:MAG: hypothetical protein COB49_11360 [Alphaproteobacteria bacterium]|nr:MAG: hypothetical protein COB49_11360 [Alphaproteobacteria bacterium]